MPPILPQRWLITPANAVDDPTIFPLLVGQSFLTGKSPMWQTSVATSVSGRERRQRRWSYPRWQFKVAYEVLRDAPATPDLARLWAFFNAQAGKSAAFGFLDPTDCIASAMPFGTGDGTTTAFQITRTVTFGGVTFSEPVARAIGATFTVGGSPAAATLGPGGIVTFATAPATGAALAWSGRWVFVVRFDTDQLEAAQMMTALWSQSGITLLSLKGEA